MLGRDRQSDVQLLQLHLFMDALFWQDTGWSFCEVEAEAECLHNMINRQETK